MRWVAALILAVALAACAPQRAQTCDIEIGHEVALTGADAPDRVTARAIGPSCDKAIALLIVASADGDPIWSWTAPMAHAFGDAFLAPEYEYVESFLDRWATLAPLTTAAAPAWRADGQGFAGGIAPTLDRETYEDIRARDLPMLCHLSGVARETCIFWEPGAARAGLYFERDIALEEESAP